MKKFLSILLTATVVLSVLIFPASASRYIGDDIERANGSREYLYVDRVKEYHNHWYDREIEYLYREFAYYRDENSEVPDWVLMNCQIMPEPWGAIFGAVVGDRVLYVEAGPGSSKLGMGLAVYIPKTDTFIDLTNDNMEQIVEICPDFIEVIEEKKIGQLLGDTNGDDRIDILDATNIQRVLAEIDISYIYNPAISSSLDFRSPAIFIYDYDHDGETTILDATAIQMMSAGLEI